MGVTVNAVAVMLLLLGRTLRIVQSLSHFGQNISDKYLSHTAFQYIASLTSCLSSLQHVAWVTDWRITYRRFTEAYKPDIEDPKSTVELTVTRLQWNCALMWYFCTVIGHSVTLTGVYPDAGTMSLNRDTSGMFLHSYEHVRVRVGVTACNPWHRQGAKPVRSRCNTRKRALKPKDDARSIVCPPTRYLETARSFSHHFVEVTVRERDN